MKVISIIQPWATLIALGEKKFETRSWAMKHRGELLIHASKKIDKDAWINEIIYIALRKHGILTINDLPVGSIIAKVNLIGSYCIGNVDMFQKEAELPWVDRLIWGNEYDFGWYEEGRFAWELADVKQIEPIPAKGRLGLWNYQEGDKLIE